MPDSKPESKGVRKSRSVFDYIISDGVVVFVIAVNALILFLDAFPSIHAKYGRTLSLLDNICIVFFIVEAYHKIQSLGIRRYWADHWNKFDFFIVLICLPVLVDALVPTSTSELAVLTLFRLGRFLRFIRLMRFLPNSDHIWRGLSRALKASISIFMVLFTLNLILAIGATMLFGDLPDPAPRYFGDPLTSLYTMFKVFTVEGWYEVPDELVKGEIDQTMVVLVRCYFVFSVLIGGILGLSLANAIFVDEMTTDNNEELEQLVLEMREEIRQYRQELNEFANGQSNSDVS